MKPFMAEARRTPSRPHLRVRCSQKVLKGYNGHRAEATRRWCSGAHQLVWGSDISVAGVNTTAA